MKAISLLYETMLPIAKDLVRGRYEKLDVWTSSKLSREENPDFKKKLITFYGCAHPTNPREIKCMILNEFLPKELVIGAHIFKVSTKGQGLEDFGLKKTDLFSEKNGMLLYKSIEKAFDVKDLCFLYDSLSSPPTLQLKVLNPSLLGRTVIESRDAESCPAACSKLVFAELNGRILVLPTGISPFKRILNWHAVCSVRNARIESWLSEDEAESFEPYFSLSDGALQPQEINLDNLESIMD